MKLRIALSDADWNKGKLQAEAAKSLDEFGAELSDLERQKLIEARALDAEAVVLSFMHDGATILLEVDTVERTMTAIKPEEA